MANLTGHAEGIPADSVTADRFAQLLTSHSRIAIAGGPRTGKSTLSATVTDRIVYHSDDFRDMSWSEVPHRMLEAIAVKDRFVIEGVMVARMLRKAAQLGQPCPVDVVVWREHPKVPRTPGQESMAKGIAKVFREWRELDGYETTVVEL